MLKRLWLKIYKMKDCSEKWFCLCVSLLKRLHFLLYPQLNSLQFFFFQKFVKYPRRYLAKNDDIAIYALGENVKIKEGSYRECYTLTIFSLCREMYLSENIPLLNFSKPQEHGLVHCENWESNSNNYRAAISNLYNTKKCILCISSSIF